MSSPLFSGWRNADPPPYPQSRKCLIFAWIGQEWNSCEECGKPLWEHMFHPPYGGQKPRFHVKQFVPDHPWTGRSGKGRWVWKPVGDLIDCAGARKIAAYYQREKAERG